MRVSLPPPLARCFTAVTEDLLSSSSSSCLPSTSYLLSLTRNYYQCQNELCDLMMGRNALREAPLPNNCLCWGTYFPSKQALQAKAFVASQSLGLSLALFVTFLLRGWIVNMDFNTVKELTGCSFSLSSTFSSDNRGVGESPRQTDIQPGRRTELPRVSFRALL